MTQHDPIVIASFARTPMGGFQGDLKSATAPELGSAAISAALTRARVAAEDIDEVLMGCVLPAGLGQAPARQAAIGAGLPFATGATTINKMCGSGMKAAMLAHDLILAGSANMVVAGGMESMTNAPYLLDRARSGYRMGHGRVVDHMFLDGLEDDPLVVLGEVTLAGLDEAIGEGELDVVLEDPGLEALPIERRFGGTTAGGSAFLRVGRALRGSRRCGVGRARLEGEEGEADRERSEQHGSKHQIAEAVAQRHDCHPTRGRGEDGSLSLPDPPLVGRATHVDLPTRC